MIEDTLKSMGYGFYPDWRWRCAMKYARRIGYADTPEEYFAGPGEEVLLADDVLVSHVFPYLKRRLDPEADREIPGERKSAIEQAIGVTNEEYITPSCLSLNLEAGILGQQPLGELLDDHHDLSPMAQVLYERLFFDVRSFLNDIAAICRLLFHDKERVHKRGAYDLLCKVTAYALGFDEYHAWRNGSSSARVKIMQTAINHMFLYMDGLEVLGSNDADDMEMAFHRFFVALPGIIARSGASAGVRKGYHEYTSDEMTVVAEMIPGTESATTYP